MQRPWIRKAFFFGGGSRWWVLQQAKVPLLDEIREGISHNKAARFRQPNVVVALQIRGRVVLVKNHPRQATLAVKKGTE